jgi:hypothetical protein
VREHGGLHDVVDADTGEVIFKANEKITPRRANQSADAPRMKQRCETFAQGKVGRGRCQRQERIIDCADEV